MGRKNKVIEAVAAYYKKQKPKPKRQRIEREEPVVEAIQYWAKTKGITLRRYESKAIRKVIRGRVVWQNSGLDYGTPDLMGVGAGYSVAIEVKAPGKRSALRPEQRRFLTDTIKAGGFGVVADDETTLDAWWSEYLRRKAAGEPTQQWLMGLLPMMRGNQTYDI